MIITITNNKGGVGKTTTARELLYGLSAAGYKTLGIDLDPQCNLSMLVNADFNNKTLKEVISHEIDSSAAIQQTEGFYFLASNKDLENILATLPSSEKNHFLSDILESVKDRFDYIIIDTPPALHELTLGAYRCSDYLIIPANAELLSQQGLHNLHREIKAIQKYENQNLKIMGILINRVKNGNFPKLMLQSFSDKAAELFDSTIFESLIRDSIAVQESQFMKKGISEYKKGNSDKQNITNDFEDFIKEVINYESK